MFVCVSVCVYVYTYVYQGVHILLRISDPKICCIGNMLAFIKNIIQASTSELLKQLFELEPKNMHFNKYL